MTREQADQVLSHMALCARAADKCALDAEYGDTWRFPNYRDRAASAANHIASAAAFRAAIVVLEQHMKEEGR